MVYKLLNEYKNIFSFNKRYFQYFHRVKIILTFFLMISIWFIIYILIKFYHISIPHFIYPLPMLLIIPLVLKEVNRVIKEVHKMNSVKEFNEKCKSIFLDRVKLNKIDIGNKQQMNMLIKLIDNEIKELKPNFFLNRGIVAGLFAPLWINYISSLYKNEVNDWKDATSLLLGFSTILAMLLIIGYQLKVFLYDDLLNSDYEKMRRMNNLLKDSYLISLNSDVNNII